LDVASLATRAVVCFLDFAPDDFEPDDFALDDFALDDFPPDAFAPDDFAPDDFALALAEDLVFPAVFLLAAPVFFSLFAPARFDFSSVGIVLSPASSLVGD